MLLQGLLLIRMENMDLEKVQLYTAIWIALDMRPNCLSVPKEFIPILVVIPNLSLVFSVLMVSVSTNNIVVLNSKAYSNSHL